MNPLSLSGRSLSYVANPSDNLDAANKLYVDTMIATSSKFNDAVINEIAPLSLSNKILSNVSDPI